MSATYRHFTQVDVFTTRRFEGNPLAVFQSGAGLSKARMQAIACEMNLSETTFLFPPSRPDADARVRIFTVAEELPFAGHPTLGTAFVVARSRPRQKLIRLQMKVGVIPVEVRRRAGGTYLEMRQRDPVFGDTLPPPATVAASDLDPRYPVQVVSTGFPFQIVPLRRLDAIRRMSPGPDTCQPYTYYLVTGETGLAARMFFHGIEDPATGSAAGCAAAYLVRHGRCRADTRFLIRQGDFMRRPSRIFAAASLDQGRVHNVRVGGHVVEVLEGRLRL